MDLTHQTQKGFQSWWKGKGEGYWIGAKQFLDHQREWYLDRATGKLYFIPPKGTDPETMVVHIKDRDFIINLNDRAHVEIDGVATLMGSVSLENAEHCIIRNCTLLYGGQHSFFDDPYNYKTDDRSRSGVFISGNNNGNRSRPTAKNGYPLNHHLALNLNRFTDSPPLIS